MASFHSLWPPLFLWLAAAVTIWPTCSFLGLRATWTQQSSLIILDSWRLALQALRKPYLLNDECHQGRSWQAFQLTHLSRTLTELCRASQRGHQDPCPPATRQSLHEGRNRFLELSLRASSQKYICWLTDMELTIYTVTQNTATEETKVNAGG